jgi:nitroimidazol reductase NimA-like FMN-containing flavoprotein (pyridoxamine 5'-phosphate oxidase superfamily)
MATWKEVTDAAGELAADVQARFEATGLALLATLRQDGSPRICGVEPLFWDGDLWLGMMPKSRKSEDLRRDPRFALHSATADKELSEGDAKVSGRVVEVTDEEEQKRYLSRLTDVTGNSPPLPFDLYRAEVTEVSMVTLGEPRDHLVIRWWRPGEEVHTHKRS